MRITIIAIFLSLTYLAISQANTNECDVIIKSDSTKIYVLIMNVLTTRIEYKNCNDSVNQSKISIGIKEVIKYKYALGDEYITPRENWQDTLNSKIEFGLSFNSFVPKSNISDGYFGYGIEFRYRLKDHVRFRQFVTAKLIGSGSNNIEEYYSKYNVRNYWLYLGYRGQLKTDSRFRFSFDASIDLLSIYYNNTPFDTISQSYQPNESNRRVLFFIGITPKIGGEFYFSQRCFLQVQTGVTVVFSDFNPKGIFDLGLGAGVFSGQLPSIGFYFRL